MNLADMTVSQLEELNLKLSEDQQAIRNTRKAIAAVLDVKRAEESAAKKLAAMSPAEQKAAAQIISGAGGIKSGETVGTPGAN